jgi:hypothetical protein
VGSETCLLLAAWTTGEEHSILLTVIDEFKGCYHAFEEVGMLKIWVLRSTCRVHDLAHVSRIVMQGTVAGHRS